MGSAQRAPRLKGYATVENSRDVVIDACQMAVLKVGDGVAATM
jgi:hypothetical protein